ncbi:uncharacterized protein LOC141651297 [Silene latifolia]|uniref:uncharacterized protein LOC141651297 n=1 Tax=Silene latifolia TaxID=37657 RepID=UPI003D771D4F
MTKPTWAERLAKSPVGMELHMVKESSDSGVVIDAEDIEDEIAYWANTLVGQFIGGKPSLIQVKEFVGKNWNHVQKPEVLYYKKGWFFFRFPSEGDLCTVLRGSTWSLGNHSLVLKRWTPQISKELDSVSRVPVWVTLPDLDPIFWSAKALSKIASKIGTPLYADPVTTHKERLSFARIMIEVDVSQKLPDDILLHTPFGQVLQRVVYEWLPYYCSHCKKLGHEVQKCRHLKPKPVQAPVTVAVSAPTQVPSRASAAVSDPVTAATKSAPVADTIQAPNKEPVQVAKCCQNEGILDFPHKRIIPVLSVSVDDRVTVHFEELDVSEAKDPPPLHSP